MKVKNWMRKDVKTVATNSSVASAAGIMKDNFVASLVVINGGQPVGIVTERDICYKVVALNKSPLSVTVGDIMTKTLITANMNDTISEVSRRMGLAKIKQIPIVDDAKNLVGIITSTDLIRVVSHLQKDLSSIVDAGK